MEQSELNRFDNNKNKTEPRLQLNNELKTKNIMHQTQANEKKPKQTLILQDEEPVLYSKPKNPNKDLISMKGEKILKKPVNQNITINNNNYKEQVIAYNPIIINQTRPKEDNIPKFGFIPTPIVCPYCQQSSTTLIEESFNCFTCFLYIFVIMLIPILLIMAAYSGCHNVRCDRGCDCDCNGVFCVGLCDCKCCFDTNHYCPLCGKLIGTRSSCAELCPCFTDCC